jgi:hypothetical protein
LPAQPETKPPAASVATPPPVSSNAVTTAAVANASSPTVSEVAAAPKPALKLQGMIYHPKHPSVIINGKALFVGDAIDGFRVTTIAPDRVTLVGGGTTNVLLLQ